MKDRTCYDLLPISQKLIVFDTELGVKKALATLLQHSIVSRLVDLRILSGRFPIGTTVEHGESTVCRNADVPTAIFYKYSLSLQCDGLYPSDFALLQSTIARFNRGD